MRASSHVCPLGGRGAPWGYCPKVPQRRALAGQEARAPHPLGHWVGTPGSPRQRLPGCPSQGGAQGPGRQDEPSRCPLCPAALTKSSLRALPRVHTAGPSHSQQRTKTTRTHFTKQKFKQPTKSCARASARRETLTTARRLFVSRQTPGMPGGFCSTGNERPLRGWTQTRLRARSPLERRNGPTERLPLREAKASPTRSPSLQKLRRTETRPGGRGRPQRDEARTSRRRAGPKDSPAAHPEGEQPGGAQGGARPPGREEGPGGQQTPGQRGRRREEVLTRQT